LGLGLSLAVGHCYYEKSRQDAAQATHVQERRELPRISGFPATFHYGTETIHVESAMSFQMGLFTIGVDATGVIVFDGEIRESTGRVIATVRGSELLVHHNAKYDVNSDLAGFEVVDAKRRPVLQCYKRADDSYQINYVAFEVSGRTQIAVGSVSGDSGWWLGLSPREVERARGHVHAMFRYPGRKFPGMRAEWARLSG